MTAKKTKREKIHPLRTYMDEASKPGRTKRTAARLALSAAMHDGLLKPGDPLPPEVELTKILGVSLGTVQAALRQLQETGVIVRRRGDGSRVASTEPLHTSIWHFRFVRLRDGTPLHQVAEYIAIETIKETGMWSAFLGDKPAYLRISRRYAARDCAPFGAEMYLDPQLVPGLATVDPDEFKMVNIRTQLEARYGIVVRGTRQLVQLAKLGDTTAKRLGLKPRQQVFEIHASTFGPAQHPIYFQRIFVPASDYALDFSMAPMS